MATHDVPAVEQIVQSVIQAITDGRLAPGSKLVEEKLGGLFGVSRTIARQALQQLAAQHLVNLEPARGAFVAVPSLDEAREIFAVRRMLEVQFVREFTANATAAHISALEQHLKRERKAIASGDVAGRARLLAQFHIYIAHLHGNTVLEQLLTELTARCQLVTLVYQSTSAAEVSNDEHAALVRAIAAGQPDKAAKLMDSHLRHVEQSLEQNASRSADLQRALGVGNKTPVKADLRHNRNTEPKLPNKPLRRSTAVTALA